MYVYSPGAGADGPLICLKNMNLWTFSSGQEDF